MTGSEFWLSIAVAVIIGLGLYIANGRRNKSVSDFNARKAFDNEIMRISCEYAIIVKIEKGYDPSFGCKVILPVDWHLNNPFTIQYDSSEGQFTASLLPYKGVRYTVAHGELATLICNRLNNALKRQREAFEAV